MSWKNQHTNPALLIHSTCVYRDEIGNCGHGGNKGKEISCERIFKTGYCPTKLDVQSQEVYYQPGNLGPNERRRIEDDRN